MEFDIKFTTPVAGGALGELHFGGEIEYFESGFSYWSKQQYVHSWIDSLARALETNERTALIVHMNDPKLKSSIHWWPVYPAGENVYFQEQYFSLHAVPFTEDVDLFRCVPKRGAKYHISEWVVRREAVAEWVLQKNNEKMPGMNGA